MLQQKIQEERLKKREQVSTNCALLYFLVDSWSEFHRLFCTCFQELAEREIDLLERELSMMIIQQERAAAAAAAPTPKKRKGKFKKSRLRLLKKDSGNHISTPTGMP